MKKEEKERRKKEWGETRKATQQEQEQVYLSLSDVPSFTPLTGGHLPL